MDQEKLSDFTQGLAAVLVTAFGLSVVLFGGFVVARAMAPPVQKPIVWKSVISGVKPDSVYAGPPVSVTAPTPPPSGKTDDIIYFAPTTATLPELVSSPQPLLPKGTPSEGCESTVMVRITIDPQGAPKNPGLKQPTGCGLDMPALRAVMDWRFRPAQLDGKAIPVGAWVQVHFR